MESQMARALTAGRKQTKTRAKRLTSRSERGGPAAPKSASRGGRTGDGFARVVSAFAADPELAHVAEDYASRALAPSRAFGSNGLKVNGKLFALVSSKGEFVVKLPKARVEALVGAGVGRPFEPGPGRLMKEWLTVTSSRAPVVELAKEAYAFVGGAGKRKG
jgi:hypothetical protein